MPKKCNGFCNSNSQVRSKDINRHMAGYSASKTNCNGQTEIQNILLAVNVRWWNAEAAYAINAARGLTELGCNVWLAVNRDSPAHLMAVRFGIPVVADLDLDSFSPLVQLKNFKRLTELIRRNRIQVLNSFKSNGSFLFSLLRRKFPGIVYIKTRGEARAPKNHPVNRFLYGPKACDGIVAAGKKVEQWMRDLAPNSNIRTIYYGNSAMEYEREISSEAVRKRYAIPGEATVLSLVGRTQKGKGHLLLLESLRLMNSKNLHLLFLVKDLQEFPQEMARIHSYIAISGLQKQVTILGFQKRLGNLMRLVDIGIVPSTESEVNCRVAVEFMSLGKPVVAFPTGSLPEVVQHGKTGLICSGKTARDLKGSLEKMLNSDYAAMGRSGYEVFRERFDLPVFSRRLYAFYRQCRRSNLSRSAG